MLKRRDDFYEQSLPTPADVLPVIEVADMTPEYDRQIKVPLFACAGAGEEWTANLMDEQVEIYAQFENGVCQWSARRGETITAQATSNLTLSVEEILCEQSQDESEKLK